MALFGMSYFSPFPEVEPDKPIEVTEVFVSSDMSMKVCPSGNYRVKSANENNSGISLVISNYLLDPVTMKSSAYLTKWIL
jgi:hypothetical protein